MGGLQCIGVREYEWVWIKIRSSNLLKEEGYGQARGRGAGGLNSLLSRGLWACNERPERAEK
jgi:hypothetical protein